MQIDGAKISVDTKDDLEEAVKSSSAGFKVWRNISAEKKGYFLIKVAEKLKEKKDQMSKIMTLEQGKITLEASLEIDRAIDAFQYNGERAKKIDDYVVADRENGLKTLIKPHPVGVTLGLTAWNFPIILISRKLAPALAAGCSMIIKPSEETPGTAVLLCKILEEAGLPKGVVNLVFGVPSEISDFLFEKNEIRKVSFTGSVPVGKLLAKKAASTLKRFTLELGGHSPAIIADDANIDNTLDILTGFKFRNAGQVCIAPSRFFIHEKIYNQIEIERGKLGIESSYFKLSDHHREMGLQALKQLGVPGDAWYVTLHVREPGFRGPEGTTEDWRNANPLDYIKAIKAVTKAGGWVFRMGDPSMTPLPKMPQVIDYALNEIRCDWMDIFLGATCKFLIGTGSGYYHIPAFFGVPCIMTNFPGFAWRWRRIAPAPDDSLRAPYRRPNASSAPSRASAPAPTAPTANRSCSSTPGSTGTSASRSASCGKRGA